MNSAPPIAAWLESDNALLRLRLTRPKANLFDKEMISAISSALSEYRGRSGLRAAILDAEGPHFSFGASVEEHLPAHCADMLAALHGLVIAMLEWPAPILCVTRGQCLGGGLEVAMAASQIFAARDAKFAQPEIRLGLFAPAASCMLPARVGQPAAEDLLVSGRTIDANEALAIGLIQRVCDDPERDAVAYVQDHLRGKSSAALARAMTAARASYVADVRARIANAERLYLDDLMKTRDANEGLEAFLQKRDPVWLHR